MRTLFVRTQDGGIQAVAFKVRRTTYKPFFDPVEESRLLVADILPEEAERAFQKAFSGD